MNDNTEDTWTNDALEREDVEAVKQRVVDDPTYLESCDSFGATPLMTAVGFDDVELVEFMLQHDANPNVEVQDGYTCLHLATDSDEPESLQVTQQLIAAGADLQAPGINGWSPLHMAAARGFVEKAKLLLSAGAPVDKRLEIDGQETPLMEAARNGHAEMVQLLLDNGADATLTDVAQQQTPIEMARESAKGADPEIYETLKDAKLNFSSEEILAGLDVEPEDIETLKAEMEDFDMAESYKENANRLAEEGEHDEVIRILTEHERAAE